MKSKISNEALELLGALFLLIITILLHGLVFYIFGLLIVCVFNINYDFTFLQALVISLIEVYIAYDFAMKIKKEDTK